MSADALSTSSRAFYEQTRFKMAASIFLASMSMMSLAYVSTYGGESNAANFQSKRFNSNTDDENFNAQIALSGGYGFGSFMFFVAFAVFLSGAIYISPLFCGSNSEKKMISKPQEIEEGYAPYADSTGTARGPALGASAQAEA
mmetsp:Transcript_58637/g.103095  ORF Transcript_58637/g.103095 Transcript_58637/m.103095 type:complete len:143 (-) Transcript_58637:259-687(-)|eukprot:CAMPEP_0184967108 /NCGR_PEP_ID=MMETSP1098-20130426/608_1 /TAXON_ID=89044 /ORGANISM="Spumella elongata, Strain CCAP 955/1" /LENGTH=142 /DNA_ID=CAMNT_0027488521 /DNA_START=47 /DNA_END=475 /DNA_ORIENTATION=-